MTRPDQDYERFIQNVYQTLLNAESKATIEVKGDIKLRGLSGQEHQIDVYWKYKQAGITYETAVECKLYKNNVGIGKVRDFQGVLADIPGLRGIFATKSGYQSGAITYAKAHNIVLLVIREPEEKDYEWRNLNVELLGPYAKLLEGQLKVVADLNWYLAQGSHPEDQKVAAYGDGSDIFLENRSTGERKTIIDLRQQLSVSAQDLPVGKQYRWIFPDVNKNFENTWLHFPEDSLAEPIKILQLEIPFVVAKGFWVFELEQVTENHHVVVKDALRDEHTFYDKEGREKGKKFRY